MDKTKIIDSLEKNIKNCREDIKLLSSFYDPYDTKQDNLALLKKINNLKKKIDELGMAKSFIENHYTDGFTKGNNDVFSQLKCLNPYGTI